MELFRNLLIFFVSVSVSASVILMFLSWVLSGFKNVAYFRNLTRIYTEYLPENTNLDEGSGPIPIPVIYYSQTGIISRLVVGLKELLVLSARVRQDYNTGGMTMTHYGQLQVGIVNLKNTFQKNLAQRFNEYLSNSEELDLSSLRHYYTAGYLRSDDLRNLETKWVRRGKQELRPAAASWDREPAGAVRSEGPRPDTPEPSMVEAIQTEPRKLGQILMEKGFVSKVDTDQALERQRKDGKKIGELLVQMGRCKEEEIRLALDQQRLELS